LVRERGFVTATRSAQPGFDEADVTLLDALHANPRVSFERLGPILGISPATAARRWQRLAQSGRAWVSSVAGPQLSLVAAVYQVRAQPGSIVDVADALSAIPQVISVYGTDGAFDLHALVFAGDMHALSRLLLERLPRVPGIAMARAHVSLEWFSGVHWRLGAIDAVQKQSVAEGVDDDRRRGTRSRAFQPADRALFLALQRDGRARYRELARQLGTSEQMVRRRLDGLVRRGMLAFRTDFARGEGGWPAEYVLWLNAPSQSLAAVGRQVSRWAETRICLSAVGSANVMVMVQVHQLSDLAEILERIEATLPDTAVVDQRLVLRAFKSWGRVLDLEGHAVDVVPVDPWAPVLSSAAD
jgi:DNA-binding Lrp family transcriptional regulator